MNPKEDFICPTCKKQVDEILEFILMDGNQSKDKWYQCRTCYDKVRQNWEMCGYADNN